MRFQVAVLLPLFVSLGFAADPALTVYNRQFAVVRETIALDLKQGLNQIQFTGTTAQLEPESVMLRDPTGQRLLRILEQNYRADPVSLEALMQRYEGQTIDFEGRVRPRERRQGRSPLRPRRVFDDADFHGLFFVISHFFYRWNTWEITTSSMPFNKTDAQTIEFRVPLQPDEEKTVSYIAHYTW